jgi:tetratricopeptide (TPR) repeat protein
MRGKGSNPKSKVNPGKIRESRGLKYMVTLNGKPVEGPYPMMQAFDRSYDLVKSTGCNDYGLKLCEQKKPSGKFTSSPREESPMAERMINVAGPISAWSEEDFNLHKLLLLELMDKEEFAQAKIVAQHLTDLQPEEPYAWYLRGVALLELYDPQQAEHCLLKSMEIQGTDAADCYQMSRVRLLQGDLEGAGDWCSRALELDPEKTALHWLLMKIHSLRGDTDAAIAVGKEVLPNISDASDEVRTRLKLATLSLHKSNFDEAEEQLQEAMKLEPNNAELWPMLGHCLSRQHKTEEALNAFQRAVEIDPNDPNNLYNLADACLGIGQPDKAVNPLLRAVQLQHDFSHAHYDLSLAYLTMKKYKESEMAARAALRDDPSMEFQRSNLGLGATENLGLALMNQGRLEEAEACFRRNLQLCAKTYFNLGLTQFRSKRYGDALKNFQRALELEPEDPEYHNLLGQTYDELGHPGEAERSLRLAIEIDPKYAIGYYDLGVILAKRDGRREEASEAFQHALKLDPNLLWAYYATACLHAIAGEEKQALELLEKAFRRDFREFDHIETDTDWDRLRTNPKFVRLLEKYRDTEMTARMSPVSRKRTYLTNQ